MWLTRKYEEGRNRSALNSAFLFFSLSFYMKRKGLNIKEGNDGRTILNRFPVDEVYQKKI